jgi:pyruvate dehydrogenase E1 component
VTSYSELRRNALEVDRWNRLHPDQEPRRAFVSQCLEGREGPFVAASDYMKLVPDQIRPWVTGHYEVLGTDGYGRSDTRKALRSFFEVDRHHIVIAALDALADDGRVARSVVKDAITRYGINAEKPYPATS